MSMAVFPSQVTGHPRSHSRDLGFSRTNGRHKLTSVESTKMRDILPRPDSGPPAVLQNSHSPPTTDATLRKQSPFSTSAQAGTASSSHSRGNSGSSSDTSRSTSEHERRFVPVQDSKYATNNGQIGSTSRAQSPLMSSSQRHQRSPWTDVPGRKLPPLHTQNLPQPQIQPVTANGHAKSPVHVNSPSHSQQPPLSANPVAAHGANVHPVPIPAQVLQIASNALSPGQGLFENAWRVTSLHVQVEMAKMHNHYTNMYQSEKERSRQIISRLKEDKIALKESLEQAKQEIKYEKSILMRENRRLAEKAAAEDGDANKSLENELAQLIRDNRLLTAENSRFKQESAKDEVVRARLQQENTRLREELQHFRQSAGNTSLRSPGAVDSVSQGLEIQLANSLAQVREEKLKRTEAERKLSEVQDHLRMIASDSAVISPRVACPPRPADLPAKYNRTPDTSPRIASTDHPDVEPADRLSDTLVGSPSSSSSRKHDLQLLSVVTSGKSPSFNALNRDTDVLLVGYESEPGSPDVRSVTPHMQRRTEERFGDLHDELRPRKRLRRFLEDGKIVPEPESREGSPNRPLSSGMGALKQILHAQNETSGLVRPDSPPPGSRRRASKDQDSVEAKDESHRSSVVSSPLATPPQESCKPNRSPLARRKLGIHHIDLLYDTSRDTMECRMCISRRQQHGGNGAVKSFPQNSSWAVLIGHCETEHASACEELEKLSPSQVVELQQHMKHEKKKQTLK